MSVCVEEKTEGGEETKGRKREKEKLKVFLLVKEERKYG